MKTLITTEIDQTMEELVKVFSLFKDEQIDKIPFEGSWTAGQVAEHMVKAIGQPEQFFNNNAVATTGRAFDANVEMIRNLFLDFSTKMKSPDFILPTETHHNKADLLQTFESLHAQLLTVAKSMDLTLTCESFEMPGTGFLTRFEWLNFFIVHTKRHTNQLQNISEAM